MNETDEATYERHATELTRFATALVGPSDAADVVSIAMVASFTSRGWSEVANRRAYLYRSVLNTSHSWKRTNARRRDRELAGADRTTAVLPPDYRPEVLEAVEGLSPQQRAVIFLTYWEDLSTAQVAERLDIAVGTVKRHLDRARTNLRRKLDV